MLHFSSFPFIYGTGLIFFSVFFNCLSSVWRHRDDYFCLHCLQISGAVAKFQSKSKPAFKSSDDILSKMWGCVRASNGIKVLLSLLMVKTPLVDADCIRALACKALCGLSRSDKIRQVIGKLQLFNSGQLQSEYCTAQCFLHTCPTMYIIQLGVPVGKMKRVLCSDRYLSSYPLGVSRFYLAQDKRLRCEDLQSL